MFDDFVVTSKLVVRWFVTVARALVIPLVLFVIIKLNVTGSIIYKEHMEKYPYCGSMYQPPIEAAGRAANAEDAKKRYRWAVYLRNINFGKTGNRPKYYQCSGSVITDRY